MVTLSITEEELTVIVRALTDQSRDNPKDSDRAIAETLAQHWLRDADPYCPHDIKWNAHGGTCLGCDGWFM